MLGFTTFDVIVTLIILMSLVAGFARGFTTEFLKLLAWAGAIFLTIVGLPVTTGFMLEVLPYPTAAIVIALILSFIISLYFLGFLAKFIGERIRTSFIGPLDRILGAAFGFVRGILVLSAVYLMYSHFVPPEKQGEWIQDARFYGFIATGAEFLEDITPDLFEKAKEVTGQVMDGETSAILDNMKTNMPTSKEAVEEAVDYTSQQRDQLSGLIQELGEDETPSETKAEDQ